MGNSIEIEGMEEFAAMLDGMTITQADEKKAMRKALVPIAEKIEENTPRRSGKLAKLSKTVKKDDFATVGTVKTTAWWDIFQEFGTSKQKANVGYFDRAVKESNADAVGILASELLKKAK